MKSRFLIACAIVLGGTLRSLAGPTAEEVVQRQVEAYNARDIEAFLATYATDAQLFELPDKLLARGTAQLRERYTERFADPRLNAQIVNRIVVRNTVIDHERVRLTLPEGPGTLEAVAIYEVRDDKITTVWFRYGERKPDTAATAE